VRKPSFLPSTRLTFVAPIFLLPFVLTSIPAILPKTSPKGTAPTKYPKSGSKKFIIIVNMLKEIDTSSRIDDKIPYFTFKNNTAEL
jgi:hypothetical protein